MLSNQRNATLNEIYKKTRVDWLEKNIPNWKEVLKFQ